MKKQYIWVGLLMGLAGQGHAQATGTWTLDVPKAWLGCTVDADCSVVNFPCGPSISVNAQHKDGTRKIICGQHNCEVAKCKTAAPQVDSAVCIKNTCAPDYKAQK